jgi:hypothetical protein
VAVAGEQTQERNVPENKRLLLCTQELVPDLSRK